MLTFCNLYVSNRQVLNFKFWKLGGTQAIGQSNKKAPRPSSGKEYTEGWHWSKGIIAKLKKGQAMASVAMGKFEPW